MSYKIRLIGGPKDGSNHTVLADPPPDFIVVETNGAIHLYELDTEDIVYLYHGYRVKEPEDEATPEHPERHDEGKSL